MNTNGEIRKLISTFMIASIALNLAPFPQDREPLDNQDAESAVENVASLERRDDAFVEPLGPEFQEYVDLLTVGDTSFIAAKFPPSKQYAVTSRQWLFISAYSSTPDQTDDTPFITASGSTVRDGIVAANFAYFGTKLRLPTLYGDKMFVVEDRMNARYPYRVDIWMRTREEAKQFGVKIVPVELLREI